MQHLSKICWDRPSASSIRGGAPTAHRRNDYGAQYRAGFASRWPHQVSGPLLDVGCGSGAYMQVFAEIFGIETVGIDFNSDYLREAKERGLEVVRAAAENLPVRNSTCGFALMIETLEHVRDESSALRETNRVLDSGSLFLVTVPNKFFPFETHGMELHGRKISHNIPMLSLMPNVIRKRCENARIYTQSELAKLLLAHNFTVKYIDYMPLPLDSVEQTGFISALRKLLFKLSKIPVIRQMGVSCMILCTPIK